MAAYLLLNKKVQKNLRRTRGEQGAPASAERKTAPVDEGTFSQRKQTETLGSERPTKFKRRGPMETFPWNSGKLLVLNILEKSERKQ